ncbi:MAG: TlpA family protein disulfide reductase, partial [Hymenobacteraceae bacterium]|nr:TlpA family protein disulfide reductase [Hymenobacteraceae bacterium]
MKSSFLNTPVRLILFLGLAFTQLLSSCTSTTSTDNAIKPGAWRVSLQAQGQEIPFIMEAAERGGKTVLYLVNGEERIQVDDIQQQGDSVKIRLHIFDA